MDNDKYISSPLGNYYGTVAVVHDDGKFLMTLENYNGCNDVEISKEFYDAFVKEFN